MSEESLIVKKANDLYKGLCKSEWNAMQTGIIVALLSILIMAWWRPWGAVGAIRNWGDWILYFIGVYRGENAAAAIGFIDDFEGTRIITKSIWYNSGSVIGLGFIGGAFMSACLGGQFALRFPPLIEYVKAVIAGVLMGIGATFAGGCNVGGMYNALGNLAANGFTMWFGLVLGVLLGLWLLYKEMEYVTWGQGGAKQIDFPAIVQVTLGLFAFVVLIYGAYAYAGYDGDVKEDYIVSLAGLLLLAAGLGYTMQRGRWCMVQGFREPHMTGDCTLAKSVALSIFLVAVGAAVLKYGVAMRAGGDPVLHSAYYVRGTFGWGGVVGGFLFGLGAMMAGGCGSGTLWRVGEGQIKLCVVVPIFGITSSLMTWWFKSAGYEAAGKLGKKIYMPDVMGYGPTLLLIAVVMMLWYIIVTWNEDANKLIVPM